MQKPGGGIYPLDKHGKISKECKRETARQLWGISLRRKENQMKGQSQINDFFKKNKAIIEDDNDNSDSSEDFD